MMIVVKVLLNSSIKLNKNSPFFRLHFLQLLKARTKQENFKFASNTVIVSSPHPFDINF